MILHEPSLFTFFFPVIKKCVYISQSLTHRLQSSSNLPCLNLYLFLSYNFQLCSTLCHQPFLFQTYKLALLKHHLVETPSEGLQCLPSIFHLFWSLWGSWGFTPAGCSTLPRSVLVTPCYMLWFSNCSFPLFFAVSYFATCRVTHHPILPELSHV